LHGPAVDQIFADEDSLGQVLWALTDNQGTIRDVAKYNAGTNTTTIVNHLLWKDPSSADREGFWI
jgi:hypothetical protein